MTDLSVLTLLHGNVTNICSQLHLGGSDPTWLPALSLSPSSAFHNLQARAEHLLFQTKFLPVRAMGCLGSRTGPRTKGTKNVCSVHYIPDLHVIHYTYNSTSVTEVPSVLCLEAGREELGNIMSTHVNCNWSAWGYSWNVLFPQAHTQRLSPVCKYDISPRSTHWDIQINGRLQFNWFCGQKSDAVFVESRKRPSILSMGVNSAELHVLNERVLSAAHIKCQEAERYKQMVLRFSNYKAFWQYMTGGTPSICHFDITLQ